MKPIRIFGLVIQSQASHDKEIEMAYRDGKAYTISLPNESGHYVTVSSLGSVRFSDQYIKDTAI